MSLAKFPQSIPSFPEHRNLWDDVDATHINQIQNEVVALSAAVGTNPAVYSETVLNPSPPQSSPQGGLETLLPVSNSYQTAVKTTNYGSVAKRLDALQKRQQAHCFTLSLGSGWTSSPSSTANVSSGGVYVKFPPPGATNDPFGLFNGTGVTLQKSGFYHFEGYFVLSFWGGSASSGTRTDQNNGNYVMSVARGTSWLDGSDFQRVSSAPPAGLTLRLKSSLSGVFSRGEVISLRIAQDSVLSHKIVMARLSGFMVRES